MEILGCFGVLVSLGLLVAPIVSLVLGVKTRRRVDELESTIRALQVEIQSLRSSGAAQAQPEAAAQPAPQAPSPVAAETPVIADTPPIVDEPVAGVAAAAYEAVVEPQPAEAPPPPPDFEYPAAAAYAAHEAGPPPEEPAPEVHLPPVTPAASRKPSFDWENIIGVKLFSWVAGIAFALAGVFFLRISIERGWLSAPVRLAFGLGTGALLLVISELRASARYRITANALTAAGIAILYASLYAGNAVWHLIPPAVAFGGMAVITAIAVVLSVRRDSVYIALLGLVGGFATPALLSSGEDRPVELFGYLLLLNGGLAWVAYRKRWPALSALTLLFTTLYQWSWVGTSLDAGELPLAAAIFLVFPLAGVAGLWLRGKDGDEPGRTFVNTAGAAAALPALFALYLAAVPAYGGRFTILFTFLLLVDLGLAAISASGRATPVLHLFGGVATVLTLSLWFAMSYRSEAWPGVLAWLAAFVLLYLAVPLLSRRFAGLRHRAIGRSAVVAPLLLITFAFLAGREDATAGPLAFFGVLILLLIACGAFAVREVRGSIYAIAGVMALVTQGVWATNHLVPANVVGALIAFAALALFLAAVPAIAFRRGVELQPASMPSWLMIGTVVITAWLTSPDVARQAVIGFAVLLAIAIAEVAMDRLRGRSVIFAIAVAAGAWIVVAMWWGRNSIQLAWFPALVLATLLPIAVLFADIWSTGRIGSVASYLAVPAYLFFAWVAGDPGLARHSTALFIALAVVNLGVTAASLVTARPALLGTGLVASQFVTALFASRMQASPSPSIALSFVLFTSAMAVAAWMYSRREASPSRATIAVLFAGQLGAAVASSVHGSPSFAYLLIAHAALVAVTLVIAWIGGVPALGVISTLISYFAVLGFASADEAPSAAARMTLATTLYAAYLLWPAVLGRRTLARREPYFAAALASLFYFLFARETLVSAGMDRVIGLLPVAQALALGALLLQLVKTEPRESRDTGRLAFVAAAALAFVTVAIPLQLDNEWITVGWALEAAALVWLYRRIDHRGLVAWSGALFAAVLVRLLLNPAVLTYHPRSETPVLNWYLYTYLVPAIALFAAAQLLPRAFVPAWVRAAFRAAGTILLFVVMNIEIADFYATGPALTFDLSAGISQDLTYTLFWALFAIAMLVAGIVTNSRAARVAALVLLVVSSLKCFLLDLMRLGGMYRVASLAGLAISLALVAVLLQKFVLAKKGEPLIDPSAQVPHSS